MDVNEATGTFRSLAQMVGAVTGGRRGHGRVTVESVGLAKLARNINRALPSAAFGEIIIMSRMLMSAQHRCRSFMTHASLAT